jgi:hypothetical protein
MILKCINAMGNRREREGKIGGKLFLFFFRLQTFTSGFSHIHILYKCRCSYEHRNRCSTAAERTTKALTIPRIATLALCSGTEIFGRQAPFQFLCCNGDFHMLNELIMNVWGLGGWEVGA